MKTLVKTITLYCPFCGKPTTKDYIYPFRKKFYDLIGYGCDHGCHCFYVDVVFLERHFKDVEQREINIPEGL